MELLVLFGLFLGALQIDVKSK